MTDRDAEFEAIKSDVTDLPTFVVRTEQAVAGYQGVVQIAEATRKHIADRRDAFKWAAALATGGLFVTLQSDAARLRADSEFGLLTLVAFLAFGCSVFAAGAYVIVSDVRVSKWLLDTYNLAIGDANLLREVVSGVHELRDLVARGDVAGAKKLSAHLDVLNDRVVNSGAFRRAPIYERFSGLIGIVTAAGLVVGVISLALRLYLV